MPELDPLGNPVGFWAIFGVLIVIVILLAVGPFFYMLSLVRANRGRRDPAEVAVEKKFDEIERRQQRLEQELKRMRDRGRPPPPD
jgi:hypothetical protein